MIINQRDKFIFVHIGKTGGTLIKSLIRKYVSNINDTRRYGIEYESHGCMSELIGQIDLDEYFKACFVRNPWDLVVSKFFYHQRNALAQNYTFGDTGWYERRDTVDLIKSDFRSWIKSDKTHREAYEKHAQRKAQKLRKTNVSETHINPQYVFSNLTLQYEYPLKNQIDFITAYTNNPDKKEDILMDKVYRYESFKPSLFSYMSKLGANLDNVEIHTENKQKRPIWFTSYKSMYDNDLVEIVRGFYSRDIEAFGYEY